jgi:hypothetical protein
MKRLASESLRRTFDAVGAGSREDNASKQGAGWIVPAKYGLAVLDAGFGSATRPERVVT